MTPGRTIVLCCVHFQINDSSGYLHTTIYLQLCYEPPGIVQRITKSQKAHISSHDGLQTLHTINFG